MISRSRGYLPHLEINQSIYFVTFRLEDGLPSKLVLSWKQEFQSQKSTDGNDKSKLQLIKDEYEQKIQKFLDSGFGACWLKDPKVARMVLNVYIEQSGEGRAVQRILSVAMVWMRWRYSVFSGSIFSISWTGLRSVMRARCPWSPMQARCLRFPLWGYNIS